MAPQREMQRETRTFSFVSGVVDALVDAANDVAQQDFLFLIHSFTEHNNSFRRSPARSAVFGNSKIYVKRQSRSTSKQGRSGEADLAVSRSFS
jgi:hypothetical protein